MGAYASKELSDLISQQVVNELRNSYGYKVISAFMKKSQLNGLALYFQNQYKEELTHSQYCLDGINDIKGCELEVLSTPDFPFTINGLNDCFNAYINIEKQTTEEVNAIYKQIIDEGAFHLIEWISHFTGFQVEEMDNADRFKKNFDECTDLVLFDQAIATELKLASD